MKIIKGIPGLLYKGYAGVIFSATLVIFYPPLYFLVRSEKTQSFSMRVFTLWSQAFHYLILMPPHRKISAALSNQQPMIICANHASYMDITIMHSVLRNKKIIFMGKHEILGYPLLNHFFKTLHIPVNRDDKHQSARAFVKAIRALKNGWSVVIFPEGGIPDGQRPKMVPFKPGAFRLAQSAGVPILPITFVNNYRLFSDPEDLWGKARPGISKVVIHQPILPQDYENMSLDELSEQVYKIIDAPLRNLY
ncbi:hypothetical protein GCM10009118_05290 [Wandonia haliotis]|uniref:Phospholipid/glycerol acyltransferase domain-containing protein n=1 Tax=Wandonia haliotis TaxID=574963 RepID=A0ABN1MMI6_9FLAO